MNNTHNAHAKTSCAFTTLLIACALLTLCLPTGCTVSEEGGVAEDDSRSDTNTTDTSGTADATTADATTADGEDIAGRECTTNDECPTPPGLRTCEGDVAVVNAPTAFCDIAQGICRVEGPPQRTDCAAQGETCADGECVAAAGCPAAGDLNNMACSEEGLTCNVGQECCCGECFPSLRCTCTGGQFSCYYTDACMRPACSSECDRDTPCAENQYCDYADGLCGAQGFSPGKGQCTDKPYTCDAVLDEVCRCDGSRASNQCEAAAQGHDVTRFGGCQVPRSGTFSCGDMLTCDESEYCSISLNDAPPPAFYASCLPLPEGCASPSCACLPPDDFSTCNDSTGYIVVVHPGG
jgi:hypothetical protein